MENDKNLKYLVNYINNAFIEDFSLNLNDKDIQISTYHEYLEYYITSYNAIKSRILEMNIDLKNINTLALSRTKHYLKTFEVFKPMSATSYLEKFIVVYSEIKIVFNKHNINY